MENLMRHFFGQFSLSEVNNRLGNNVTEYLTHQNNLQSNVVVSPFGLLSMVVPLIIGSEGETLRELCNILKISTRELSLLLNKFIEMNNKFADENNPIEVFNLMVSRNSIIIEKQYLKMIEPFCLHRYFAINNLAILHEIINEHVELKTNGAIKKILEASDINEETLFVLVNTIHLKSKWAEPFTVENTLEKDFFGLKGKRTENMMHHYRESFMYSETDTMQILQMPYSDERYSFTVVLPREITSEPIILDYSTVLNILRTCSECKVNVILPKFTEESEVDMIPYFKSNGATSLFNDLKIPYMTTNNERKHLTVIRQKIKIQIDETGSEASSATVAVCTFESCMPYDSKPKPCPMFNANHPFTYYISYNDVVLFSGIYV